MTAFYCFPSNQGMESEFVKKIGEQYVAVSVIGDYYKASDIDGEPEVYIGYLVNASSPVEEWKEYEVNPSSPMRIFG